MLNIINNAAKCLVKWHDYNRYFLNTGPASQICENEAW